MSPYNSYPAKRKLFSLHINKLPVLLGMTALAFLLLFPVFPAAAETVKMQVDVGWQGEFVPGRYAPAVVHLANTGNTDLTGIVEAEVFSSYTPPVPAGGQKPARVFYPYAAFGEKISLPAGGKKKVILWFPAGAPDQRVDFVFRDGKKEISRVSKTGKLMYNGPIRGAVGVLGAVPPALERIRILDHQGVPRAATVIGLTKELFPRRASELNAFDIILVTGDGFEPLEERQRYALTRWVQNGGKLIIAGGTGVKEALAVLPEGTINIKVEGIGSRAGWQQEAAWLGLDNGMDFSAAPVAELSGGEPWGPQSRPLGRKHNRGLGTLIVLSFDPGDDPWKSGVLGESLWKKFLINEDREKTMGPYTSGYRSPEAYLSSLLSSQSDSFPREAFPQWWSVGLMLLIYIIIAGPLIFLVLRRLNRPELTWLAVPVLAVVFAGGIYLYTTFTGGKVLPNVIQVVDKTGSEEKGLGFTSVGYFAPTQESFTITLEDPDKEVVTRQQRGPSLLEDNQPAFRLIRGSDLTIEFSRHTQWDMRSVAFLNHKLVSESKGITASVKPKDGSMLVTLGNSTGLELDHVTVLCGKQYKVIERLVPGDQADVKFKLETPKANQPGQSYPFHMSSSIIFQYPDGPPQVKQGMPVPPPSQEQLSSAERRRLVLMDRWGIDPRRGPLETGWPLTVIAWSETPFGENHLGLQDDTGEPFYLTMFVLTPEIDLPAGHFTLPAGMVPPEISESDVHGMFGRNNLSGIEDGSLTFSFAPRLPENVNISDLTLYFSYFPMEGERYSSPSEKPAPVPEGILEIYNAGRGEWEFLTGSAPFKLPGEYASPTGEVMVRLHGRDRNTGEGYYFLPPAVAYGGEKID